MYSFLWLFLPDIYKGNHFESNRDSGFQQLTAWRVAFCQMAKPCNFLATRVVNDLDSSCQHTIMMYWIEKNMKKTQSRGGTLVARYPSRCRRSPVSQIDATWCNTNDIGCTFTLNIGPRMWESHCTVSGIAPPPDRTKITTVRIDYGAIPTTTCQKPSQFWMGCDGTHSCYDIAMALPKQCQDWWILLAIHAIGCAVGVTSSGSITSIQTIGYLSARVQMRVSWLLLAWVKGQ